MIKGRHHARIVALQALYELDMARHTPEYALGCRLKEHPLPRAGVAFAFSLVEGVLDHKQRIDHLIRQLAPEWPVEQIAVIDRNILRIAIFEILYTPDTPPKVAVNEAVELAKMFGSDSSPRFVNGVLGTLINRYVKQVAPPNLTMDKNWQN
ncbi:MAG: transcription antitermination factor NusB [Ardenticatenia bacterium]|nr:MAG: transcription antitermination factor NusB [Ardenticatenia bacterium]